MRSESISSPGTRAMLRTRGQLRRWPRRRVSRAEHWAEGTRSAARWKTRVKDSSQRTASFWGVEGDWEGLVPLLRDGP